MKKTNKTKTFEEDTQECFNLIDVCLTNELKGLELLRNEIIKLGKRIEKLEIKKEKGGKDK